MGFTLSGSGSISGLTATGEQLNAAAGNVYSYNRQKLKQWDALLSRRQQGTADVLTVAWIGDSWTHGSGDKACAMFAKYLANRFGDSGAGYVGAQTAAEVTPALYCGPSRPVTVHQTGTWTNPFGATVGAIPATSISSEVGATMTFAGVASSLVIHYVKKQGGGSFTYQIDGGGATTVNTSTGAGATPTLGVTAPIATTDASHTLTLAITVAGTAGVELCGVEFNRAKTGSRIHNLGLSGSATTTWAGANATQWEAAITQLAPSLVVIELGVNDGYGESGTSLANYSANLQTMIDRILAATAASPTSIVLLTPGDTGATQTNPMSAYADVVKTVAQSNGIGCLDVQALLGTYAEANARVLYANTTHINANGHRLVADAMTAYLLPTREQQRNPYCTVYGQDALLNNSGINNTAFGANALKANTIGIENVAIGNDAGTSLTTGTNNVAIGSAAFKYGTGTCNTVIGSGAGLGPYAGQAFDGIGNTFIGYFAGAATRGFGSGSYSSNSVLIGVNAAAANEYNNQSVIVGANAGAATTAHEVIYIGYSSGKNETVHNALVIDNRERTVGTCTLNSIIYGIMGAAPADQTLKFNALKVYLPYVPAYADKAAADADATFPVGCVYKITATGAMMVKL